MSTSFQHKRADRRGADSMGNRIAHDTNSTNTTTTNPAMFAHRSPLYATNITRLTMIDFNNNVRMEKLIYHKYSDGDGGITWSVIRYGDVTVSWQCIDEWAICYNWCTMYDMVLW